MYVVLLYNLIVVIANNFFLFIFLLSLLYSKPKPLFQLICHFSLQLSFATDPNEEFDTSSLPHDPAGLWWQVGEMCLHKIPLIPKSLHELT